LKTEQYAPKFSISILTYNIISSSGVRELKIYYISELNGNHIPLTTDQLEVSRMKHMC